MKTLYQFTRDTYDVLLRPQMMAQRRRRRQFYGQFVAPGSVAFDVGAFRGEMSEALADAGARVIAVEPNPLLAKRLRRCFGTSIVVEEAAIGEKRGAAQLRLGHYAGHSTLSEEWAALAGPARWAESIQVRVTTLDDLIATHGKPSFIKIDVEGHEHAVLRGLSQSVPAVSFEFQCAAPHLANASLERLGELGIYEFALILLDDPEFRLSWSDAAALSSELGKICRRDPNLYGDIFARLL